jgi:hypothetical protein
MVKMKSVRALGVCLVAAFAISATAVATAQAEAPEIGRCVKVAAKAGKFSGATCIKEKSGGSYEWIPGAEKGKFTTKGGVATLQTVGGTAVGCKSETSGGEYNSTKTVTGVVVVFKECAAAGIMCNTTGQPEGELITNSLEGKVGWENKAKKKVAFDLFPGKTAPEGLFITFNCAGLHLEVKGQVLVNVPSDKMDNAVTLKYSGKKGHQKPEKFEGEPPAILLTSINKAPFEQSGQTITTTQTNEEALEVNAVV